MNEHPLKSAKVAQIARDLSISYEAVRKWAILGEVPPERLARVVELTGAAPRLLSPGLYRHIDQAETAWLRLKQDQLKPHSCF
jgi:hypothetical protein